MTLASAVTLALAGSAIYIAGANADEVATPNRVQAEAFAAQSGVKTEKSADTGGTLDVGWVSKGDWMRYDKVSVTGTDLAVRVASANAAGGSIKLHLGTRTGPVLATFAVTATGGWQKWATVKAKAASVPSGPQTVFAVMDSSSTADFVNVEYFDFGPASGTTASAPSASASTQPGTSTGASTGTSSGGWVDVDEAQWQKDLAAYNAIVPAPVTAGTTRVGEFQSNCKESGRADDDPIVFPGMKGASHNHSFFGPPVDAFTTTKSLLTTPTTCDAPGDHAAYWVPSLTQDGKDVATKSFRVYYGCGRAKCDTIRPFPQGIQFVVGDAKLQVATPKGTPNQFWCVEDAEIGRSKDGNWPACGPKGHMIIQVVFKQCWDGKHVDSPDHKSHMSDPVNGKCDGTHPVALPEISLMVNYATTGGEGLKLSSGLPSTIHADFMNAWEAPKIAALVKTCLNQTAKCGTTPTFVGG
ncbi:DUF1996 domain-containing protein [Actinoplanes sp. NPDC049596]|uniref:DUF1996 domain-containing protein n=1 Tax=unclassified Actinoplanes TaxID=2626549 RepID=UPI0034459C5E